MKTIAQKIGMAKEELKEVSGVAKPFPSDAPYRMHKKYYENNIGQIKKIYKEAFLRSRKASLMIE